MLCQASLRPPPNELSRASCHTTPRSQDAGCFFAHLFVGRRYLQLEHVAVFLDKRGRIGDVDHRANSRLAAGAGRLRDRPTKTPRRESWEIGAAGDPTTAWETWRASRRQEFYSLSVKNGLDRTFPAAKNGR